MTQRLSLTALLVSDYDEAITFYVGKLRFKLLEDTHLTAKKRWIVVGHPVPTMGFCSRVPLMIGNVRR